jgi:hypothetical protein
MRKSNAEFTAAGAWDTPPRPWRWSQIWPHLRRSLGHEDFAEKKKEIGSVPIISLRPLCVLRVRDGGGTPPDLRHYFSRITSNREGTKNTKEKQKKSSCSFSFAVDFYPILGADLAT